MFIVQDKKGNQLLDLYRGEEEEILGNPEYRPLTSSLVVVKSPLGFMLLKNRYRNLWELPGGMIDKGETPRECALRECLEESGCQLTNIRFVGMLKFFLMPSYHLPKERIEFTALYCADIACTQEFVPNQEMSDLCWHTIGENIENASDIDINLLTYYC